MTTIIELLHSNLRIFREVAITDNQGFALLWDSGKWTLFDDKKGKMICEFDTEQEAVEAFMEMRRPVTA